MKKKTYDHFFDNFVRLSFFYGILPLIAMSVISGIFCVCFAIYNIPPSNEFIVYGYQLYIAFTFSFLISAFCALNCYINNEIIESNHYQWRYFWIIWAKKIKTNSDNQSFNSTWLEENCNCLYFYDTVAKCVYFTNTNEALMFKMAQS